MSNKLLTDLLNWLQYRAGQPGRWGCSPQARSWRQQLRCQGDGPLGSWNEGALCRLEPSLSPASRGGLSLQHLASLFREELKLKGASPSTSRDFPWLLNPCVQPGQGSFPKGLLSMEQTSLPPSHAHFTVGDLRPRAPGIESRDGAVPPRQRWQQGPFQFLPTSPQGEERWGLS